MKIVQCKNCQKSQGFETTSSSESSCKFKAAHLFPLVKTVILKTVIYCTTTSTLTLKAARKTNPEYAKNCGNSFCDSFITTDNIAKTQHKSTCFCRVRGKSIKRNKQTKKLPIVELSDYSPPKY